MPHIMTTNISNDFREHNESCSEDESCQAIGEPITSFPCIQDTGRVVRSEGETVLKVMQSSATPKKRTNCSLSQ